MYEAFPHFMFGSLKRHLFWGGEGCLVPKSDSLLIPKSLGDSCPLSFCYTIMISHRRDDHFP
jgi:hypothetical protein